MIVSGRTISKTKMTPNERSPRQTNRTQVVQNSSATRTSPNVCSPALKEQSPNEQSYVLTATTQGARSPRQTKRTRSRCVPFQAVILDFRGERSCVVTKMSPNVGNPTRKAMSPFVQSYATTLSTQGVYNLAPTVWIRSVPCRIRTYWTLIVQSS